MLEFREDTHEYFFDGKQVPGVNEVMQSVGVVDYSFIPVADRDTYFTRGTYVHLAMELLLKDELDWDTIDPAIEGYVRAGQQFIFDTGFKAINIETPLYHPVWGYAGTPDCVGVLCDNPLDSRFVAINERHIVIDWKSCPIMSYVRWQTAAYQELYAINGIANGVERYGVELKKTGKYKMSQTWDSSVDFQEFASFLTTYKYQKLRINDGQCTWKDK